MKTFEKTSLRLTGSALLVLIGYWAGGTVGLPSSAEAQVRETPPPVAFKSGAARSEIVLKQIAAMLERMDKRLANLENSAEELVALHSK